MVVTGFFAQCYIDKIDQRFAGHFYHFNLCVLLFVMIAPHSAECNVLLLHIFHCLMMKFV